MYNFAQRRRCYCFMYKKSNNYNSYISHQERQKNTWCIYNCICCIIGHILDKIELVLTRHWWGPNPLLLTAHISWLNFPHASQLQALYLSNPLILAAWEHVHINIGPLLCVTSLAETAEEATGVFLETISTRTWVTSSKSAAWGRDYEPLNRPH